MKRMGQHDRGTMKKRIWIFALLVATVVLLTAAAACADSAPAPVLVNYNWVGRNSDHVQYPIYTNLPIGNPGGSGDHIWQIFEFVNLHIENSEELQNEYGGAPNWVVDVTPNVMRYSTVEEGNNHLWVHMESRPTQDCTVTVTCTWGGKTAVKTFHLYLTSLPSLPTGLSGLNDTVETQVGQRVTLEPSVLPVGWMHPDYAGTYFCAGDLNDFADRDWNESVPTYTMRDAGSHTDLVGLYYGPVMVTKNITFNVAAGQGSKPVLTLDNHFEQINRYLGFTQAMEEDGILSWNALADARIGYLLFEQMEKFYGGKPAWNVQQTAGAALPISWAEEQDGHVCDVRLESWDLAGYQPGTSAEITITCTWGDQTASAVTRVNILDLPNGFPSGIDYNNGLDVVECQIGDELMITPAILPASWGGIPGYTPAYTGNSGEFEKFCNVVDEGAWGRKIKVTKAGTYQCFVGVGVDTVMAGRWITYRVKDEHGVVPGPDLDIGGYFTYTEGVDLDQTGTFYVASGLPLDAEDDGVLYSRSNLFTYGIQNWWRIKNSVTGTPDVDVELISGDVKFEKEKYRDDSEIDVWLTELPAAGTVAEFKATCTLDGQTDTRTVKIQFVQLPSRPAGVEIGYPDPMISAVGQKMDWTPEIWFKNNWEISGQATYSRYGEGEFLNWDSDTWEQSGIYTVPMLAASGNICMQKTIKAVVTEADGTLAKSRYTPFGTVATVPADLKVIESQAFAGTQLTEVDIPAGVSIAGDAFDGTGLVAIYCHDQATIDYAVQHGFVAVVE